jgi:NADPH:quinone reductase-like Zn-dependent oxidoreductase
VTGVCSTANIELVKSLGADQVIDYTKEDVTQNGQVYDAVFDAVGKLSSSQRDNLLKENGAFLTVQTTTKEEFDNLNTLKKLAEENVIKAVIDQRFPLEQVAEAHRYVESGRKKGNVVITVANQEER